MNIENRINFQIPENTLVETGFKFTLFGFEASPGDMIVENINNAPSARYLGMERLSNIPNDPMPFKGLLAKRFRCEGARTDTEYLVTVTDEGILVETGGQIIGNQMWGENVQRTIIYYRDFRVRQGNINDFLKQFLI